MIATTYASKVYGRGEVEAANTFVMATGRGGR